MAVAKALKSRQFCLYKQSTAEGFPFRYTVYVGDGDAEVFKHIVEHDPPFYGEIPIEKEECVYHFHKRLRINITDRLKNLKHTTVKKSVKTAHDTKNRALVRKHLAPVPLDYSELESSDFTIKHAFSEAQQTKIPYTMSNLIMHNLKNVLNETDGKRDSESLQKMANSIKAVARHYQDHPNATFEEREVCHIYCDASYCEYLTNRDYRPKQAGHFYVNQKDKNGEQSREVMDQINDLFDEFAKEQTMNRLTRWLTQNVNESLHNRSFRLISKLKHYQWPHLMFAAVLTAVIHNNGYECGIGQLFRNIGEYTDTDAKRLRRFDAERKRHATAHHKAIKIESKFRLSKVQLTPGEEHYIPGYGFEDHQEPLDDLEEFDERQEKREEILKSVTEAEKTELDPPSDELDPPSDDSDSEDIL